MLLALAVPVPVLVVDLVPVEGTEEVLFLDAEPDTAAEPVAGRVLELPLQGCRPDWM